jgi:hypothetical protein
MNFTAEELDSLLDAIDEVRPLSATHWENVAAIHMSRYHDTGRNVGSLKRKFKELYCKRVSTGDPHCPPAVCRAKRLKRAIIDLMDETDLLSVVEGNDEDDGEDVMPSLGGDDVSDDLAVPNELLYDNGAHPDDEVAAANAAILNAPAEAGAEGGGGGYRVHPREQDRFVVLEEDEVVRVPGAVVVPT